MNLKKNSALEKLKAQVQTNYKSNFDFATHEMENNEIAIVVNEEEKLFKATVQYSKSIKEVCNSLYQVSQLMKKEGSFMEWYNYMGFTKDKVSELLKRHQLFLELPEYDSWISSLSTLAIKELTKKEMTAELRLEVAQLGLKSIDEIKFWIADYFAKDNAISIDEEISVISDTISEKESPALDVLKGLKEEIEQNKSSEKILIYKNQIPTLKRYIK